jgi:tetrahydromethanopterin S-methyltransferase subunit G
MPMPHGRYPRIEQLEAEVVEIKKRLDDIRKQFEKRLNHITSLRDGVSQ